MALIARGQLQCWESGAWACLLSPPTEEDPNETAICMGSSSVAKESIFLAFQVA